jgi:hypothetical protein
VEHGATLEPQLVYYNDESKLREILGITDAANLATWMGREKTEAALRVAKADQPLVPPEYMRDAIRFING